MSEETDAGDRRAYKLERVVERYGLEGLGAELEARWLGDAGYERQGLRGLAELVNRRLLRAAFARAGGSPSAERVAERYRQLTDEATTSGQRTRARRELARAGLDVDRLETDFCSRTALHSYLREGRGVTKQPTGSDTETSRATLARLASRLQAVADSRLERLDQAEAIDVGPVNTIVEVRVVCPDCGTSQPVDALLAAGGCGCG
jgi:hypothetical protein